MEQFRQLGEILGAIRALMVFKEKFQINQRQCNLLFEMFRSAYDVISEGMRQNLRFEEKLTWRSIEHPLKVLKKIFREGEVYIRQCLETNDFWGKAIILYKNSDCVEFHIHNLLFCISILIEAIEVAEEDSGCDHDVIQKKRQIYSMKYQKPKGVERLNIFSMGIRERVPGFSGSLQLLRSGLQRR